MPRPRRPQQEPRKADSWARRTGLISRFAARGSETAGALETAFASRQLYGAWFLGNGEGAIRGPATPVPGSSQWIARPFATFGD
jgi:hypothetical protein